MTILVTGGSGQVALALQAAATDLPLVRVGRPAFDFDHPETIAASLAAAAPALVINAAAYTAVDQAEADADAARRANTEGPAILAAHCARAGIALIHISTDYVFDGSKGAPYVETDATSPLGVYGATKLAGEHAVLAAHPGAAVLRTSWVISHTGRNFVRTMIGAARKTDTLRVVADQRGCPTSAADLAAALLQVARRMLDDQSHRDRHSHRHAGLFHAAGSGETTWHGLAEAIFTDAAPRGLRRPAVTPITTADWPTPVRRPADSRLDCGKLEATFGVRLPDWRRSLTTIVEQALAQQP